MKLKTPHWFALGLLLLAVLYFAFRPKGAEDGVGARGGEQSGVSAYQHQTGEENSSGSKTTKRQRNAIKHEKKNVEFYFWRAGNISSEERVDALHDAFEDLPTSEFGRFVAAFWEKNFDLMEPADAVALCESIDVPEIQDAVYRTLFGLLAYGKFAENLEKTRLVAESVPPDGSYRMLVYRAYYDALASKCSTLEDFASLTQGLGDLRFDRDREGARYAIAGVMEAIILKDPSFVDKVRAWDTTDDVKRLVLVFHPIDRDRK
jgi:hypothetical protein